MNNLFSTLSGIVRLMSASAGRLAFAMMFLSGMAANVHAQGEVTFAAFDLTDTTPGQNLWRYDYRISDASFEQGQGFSIFFVPSLYANLGSPLANGSADWSVIAVQPDRLLNDPGYFDGLALSSTPDLAVNFSVTFVWLGVGTPGTQALDFYNADFSTRFSGQTMLVPEPATTTLVILGSLFLIVLRGNRFSQPTMK